MKREEISEAVGNISIQHIYEAGRYAAPQKRTRFTRGMHGRKVVAAAVLICAIMVCICSPSIARSMKGFYRDIVRWDGAVVGVEYENATDEVRIDAGGAVKEDGKLVLPLEVTLLDMSKEPYIRFMGEVALGDYQVLDEAGKEVYSVSGQQKTSGLLENGKAGIIQPLGVETLSTGTEYKLVIMSIYGLQKAEQPLKIKGHWECRFTVAE